VIRYTKEEHLLKKAKDLIQEGFSNSKDFQPNSILISTWKDVHSYLDKDNKVLKRIFNIKFIYLFIYFIEKYISSCSC
jgi:hypothetical protein